MNKYLYYWTWNLFIILLLYVWMKHPGHTYGGFVPTILEWGVTVDLLNPAVMSVIKSCHLIWCWVCLVSLWECLVFHLSWSEEMMVRIDAVVWAWVEMVETVEFRQVMWIVMLKSAKDRIVWVDTPGQHVSPRVRYGMTCWLIRRVLVSLSCWMSGTGMAIPIRPQGASGARGYFVVPNMEKP
jgi:hypothetical protein